MIADDIVALEIDASAGVVVRPGFPQFKLSPAVLERVVIDAARTHELHPGMEKQVYRPNEGIQTKSVPLRAIYVLDEGQNIEASRCAGRDALMHLVTHSYAMRFMGASAATQQHLQACQSLVGQIGVQLLKRPDDLSLLDDLAGFIEAAARIPVPRGSS